MNGRSVFPWRRHRISRKPVGGSSRRTSRFEQLENRSLLAADLTFGMESPSPVAPTTMVASNSPQGPISIRIVNGTPTTEYPSVGIVGDNTGGF